MERATIAPTGPLEKPSPGGTRLDGLYELHAPALRRHCLRLTRDPAAADDLMQEVFVRFIARFPEPPADMNVNAYLHATARNVLWKQLRDDHEDAHDDVESSLGPDDALERDPERSTLLDEQRHLVRRCAALLTGRQRQALTLREVEGHSYAEIGSELDIGVDAVAQVITRARARLRHSLRRAQIDLDQLSPECRTLLGPLSDYVDRRSSSMAPDLEAHVAQCDSCRRTLAAYQETGSRLRGAAPFAPIAATLTRLAELARGGPADAPLGIGAVASLATAAVIAVGGGGMLVANQLTASPSAHRQAPATTPHHTTTTRESHLGTPRTPVASTTDVLLTTARHRPPSSGFRSHTAARTSTTHTPRKHIGPSSPGTPTTPREQAPLTPAASPKSEPAVAPLSDQPGALAPAATSPSHTPTSTTPDSGTPSATTTPPGSESQTTPNANLPTATVSPAEIPAVTAPVVATPSVDVPSIVLPPLTTPALTTPVGTLPPVSTPAVATPKVNVPPITTPTISTPTLKIPPITTPKLP